jgi:hypothetical protein
VHVDRFSKAVFHTDAIRDLAVRCGGIEYEKMSDDLIRASNFLFCDARILLSIGGAACIQQSEDEHAAATTLLE